MNIIKLHNSNDNSVILINIADISVVDTETGDTGKRYSKIYLRNVKSIQAFLVNETPEKIYSMLSGSDNDMPRKTKKTAEMVLS